MPSVTINGYSCECFELGGGEPLVLVHGSSSDYRTWAAQQDRFAEHFRTILYSRRYHWPNERIADGADYSMPEHVDDLEALLGAVDAAPAHLVGHSYGGFLCLLLALRAPHLVRTLVLAEPPAITLFVSPTPKPQEILRLLWSRPRTAAAIVRFGLRGVAPATAALKRGDRGAALRHSATAIFGARGFARLSASRLEIGRANLIDAEFLGSGFAPLDPDQVRGIEVPVLLVAGAETQSLFRCVLDRLQELLPHAERVEIAGARHLMHEDNTADYNAAVLSFLEKHRQAPTKAGSVGAGD